MMIDGLVLSFPFFEIKGTHSCFINETSELQNNQILGIEALPQHRFRYYKPESFKLRQ
jgi:hypothetical protein